MRNSDKNKSTGRNGYDVILETFDARKSQIIPNDNNALVFPLEMRKDIDYIDTYKFYGDLDLSSDFKNNK